jgi:hypothetical protein
MSTETPPTVKTDIPPDDELLFHWTLSVLDLGFVTKRSQNPQFRVWLGLQICFLRENGWFARCEADFPPQAISWMNRQFKLHALSPLQNPGRDATWSQQRSAILEYLEWVDFAPDNQRVKTFVENQVLLGKAKSEIIDQTPEFLRGNKIVMPAKGELERSIRSEIEATSEALTDKVLKVLSDDTRSILDLLLNEQYEPYPTLFSKLQATASAPSREHFTEFVSIECACRDIVEACLPIKSILSEKLLEEYAASVRTGWSVTDLKRFAAGKRATVMASAIVVFYGELLDNIVQMFDRLVTKMDSGIEKRWCAGHDR